MATSTITGTTTDPGGGVVAGARVVARLLPTPGFRISDSSEIANEVETDTNGSGVWTLALERQSNITPANTFYEITEYVPDGGRIRRRAWNISVPNADSTLLAAIITPTGPNPPYETSTAAVATAVAAHVIANPAHAAAVVSNTPAGTIAATNVQAALNELDTEKSPTTHTHSGTSVANTPAGNIAATNVQDALNELDTEKVPLVQTRTGAQTSSAIEIFESGDILQHTVLLKDSAAKSGHLLEISHYSTGSGATFTGSIGTGQGGPESYGLDIHNFPGATTGLMIHQYSNLSGKPAMWIDNTDDGIALRLHNTQNNVINPGRDGTGPFIEFMDHGTSICKVDKDLVFNCNSTKNIAIVHTGSNAVAFDVQTNQNIIGSRVLKTGTGAGDAISVTNAGTGAGLHVNQTGGGRGIQVDANAAANTGVYGELIQGYDYGSSVTTTADGGNTFTVTKNGTAAGNALKIVNKGTGNTVQLQDASGDILTVNKNGFINTLHGAIVNIMAGSATPEGAQTAPIGSIYLRTGGAVGTSLYVKEQGAGNTGWAPLSNYTPLGTRLLATGVLAESYPARVNGAGNQAVLSTGRQHFQAIWLQAGQIVTNIVWCSATTALGGGNNQWFSLYDASRNLLRVTSDDTSTAWAANSLKSLACATTYTVPTTGLYYVGIMVNASTVPSLAGLSSLAAITGATPKLGGFDGTNTGLTTPATAPSTAASFGTLGSVTYAYVT